MYKDFEVSLINILRDMEIERSKLSHPFVGSEHLLLSLLRLDKYTILKMHDFGVTYDNFREKLINIVGECKKNVDFNLYTPLLKRVLNFAIEEAKINKQKVDSKLLLGSLIEEGEGVAIRTLLSMEVDLDVLYKSLYKNSLEKEKDVNYGRNLNTLVNLDEKVIGRDKEIASIIETLLRKKKNNPLLIGEAGVGKSAIVEELARLIVKKEVPIKLSNSVIINVDMSQIVSGTKYRGEFEEKLTKIIENSEKDENIILFIDEIHTLTNAGGAEGAIGAGDIFKPYLARGNIKVIGATTIDEYEKYIAVDKALARRFELIKVREPNLEETITILEAVKKEYESYHNIKISKKNIVDIVTLGNKFIFEKRNPDKSLDLLDSVASYVKIKNDNYKAINDFKSELNLIRENKVSAANSNNYEIALDLHGKQLECENKISLITNNVSGKITYRDIYKILESKCSVPIIFNKNKLIKKLNIELKDYVNADEIVSLINDKLCNISVVKSMYIIGESAKILEILKNNLININYININCAEFYSSESLNKILGTTAGYVGYKDKHIFSRLKTNPFGLVVFENFDLSSIYIKTLIKNIIKDSVIVDNKMENIYFNNCIIICTTNQKETKSVGFINSKTLENNELTLFDKTIVIEKKDLKIN